MKQSDPNNSPWQNVKTCPVCHSDGWCSINAPGTVVLCRREDRGAAYQKLDSAGAPFYVHRLGGPDSSKGPQAEISSHKRDTGVVDEVELKAFDEVYRAFLAELSLSDEHRADLISRGLPIEEIEKGLYRTSDPERVERIAGRFGTTRLQSVPGFRLQQMGFDGPWNYSFCSAGELLIPVTSVQGLIGNLKIRRKDGPGADGPKYRYASSKSVGGPSAKPMPHVVLIDEGQGDVVITEGEIKAHVISYFHRSTTISVPGVGLWRLALPVIRQLQPSSITVAFDQDVHTNKHVAQSFRDLCFSLREEGHNVSTWIW
jgi:hypothetical protein